MADDTHADAPEVEVISPNEALQRQRSGGFLANGQRAPEAAVVDTQAGPAGGGAAPAPQAKPVAPSDPNADPDDAYWGGAVHAEAAPKKGEKKPKVEEADPDDTYWGGAAAPAAAPVTKTAPVKKPGLWRQALDTYVGTQASAAHAAGSVLTGLGGATNEAESALNTVAAPLVQSANTWYNLITGKIRSVNQAPPTEWQDAWFKHVVDPTVENAQDFATDESAPFADKASHAIGATLGYLSQAILTAGVGDELPAAEAATQSGMDLAKQTAVQGVKMAQAPAISQAVNVGREAYQSTGDAELSFKLAAITYSSSVEQNMLPLSMPGKLPTRMATGAGMQAAGGEASREATNAVIPDEHAEMRQPFSAEGTVMNLVQGAVMGVSGHEAQNMPHQATERPQNIMEHAQVVAAAEAKAAGGDTLDQTVAATHVNAVLSAHHDAAAYEAHMETQHQRVTEENAVVDQQAEQQAREDALNQAANETAPQTTPEQGFEAQAKTLQERKDADYAKAKNQAGDQEIERGDTLAAGAEKGGEGFEKPKLLDTLNPEQAEAFKTLKERRAAEEGSQEQPNAVTERLKAQNPEDNFTPYVEPKVSQNRPKEPEGTVNETPAEGESWKTPTGATVEVLKDHGNGTYTVRTTPKDSSQLPIRRKVSESALNVMREAAEPPENLQDRRDAAATEVAPPEAAAEPAVTAEAVDAAAKESAYSPESDKPTPTQAQYEAGNYQKGHVDIQGMPVTIEHPAGTTRPSGAEMAAHYGYVKGTVAADGQHVDIMIGKHPENDTHFIVDHRNDQGYEQAKVLTGFANRLEAMRAYRKAYPDNPMGPVSEVKTPELKAWLKDGDTTKPFDAKATNRLADSRSARFADDGAPTRFRPEDVVHSEENGEHTFSSPNGITMADRTGEGNLRVIASDTQKGLRARGEGGARLEAAAKKAHETGGKLESSHEVSEPEQRRYKALADQGYDVKTNVHTTDAQGVKRSTSELKPVYEVGPKSEPMRARDQRESAFAKPAPEADRRLGPRMSKDDAETALKPLVDKIGAEGMQVHNDSTTLPPDIQQQMKDFNHPNPRAVYDPTTDTVHVVAGAHRSTEELMRTAVHESMHQGIRRVFNDVPEFQKAMKDIHDNISDRAGAIPSPIKGVNKASAKGWMKDYMSQHGLEARNPRHQELAADEYIAHLAEHDLYDPRQENPSLLRRAIDGIRAGLRKLGVVHEWTDNDIRRLIRESNNNLAAENAGIRASALAKGDGPRFADEDDRRAEQYPEDHPLATVAKFGKTMEDQANYNPGFVRKRMDWMRDKWDGSQDGRLAFIGLRNLKDFMDQKKMPGLHQFVRIHDQMDGRRGQLMQKSADIAKDWSRWISGNKKMGGTLGELMHASTLGGVDPSKSFSARYSDSAKSADATKMAHEAMRFDLHKRLRDVYNNQLDSKGRELFQTVRDHYVEHRQDVLDALEKRITESGADDNTKKQIMSKLRLQFEDGKAQGPYFPLSRFGDHWANAKDSDGNTVSFSRFESKAQKKAWLDNAKSLGYSVDGGQRMDDKSMMERIDPKFVQKVTEMVKGLDPALADDIWQEYLRAMPEMSMRKQLIHRVGRLGYSMDAMRAFAYNSFHGAHQLARLEYSNRLDNTLDNIKQQAQALNTADPNSSDAGWANSLARETARRYEWIKNPRSSPIASALTKFGFGWYLGAAPATAFRIFSQNPMLAAPMLAKYHGPIGATRELSKASAQWAMAKGSLGDTLRGDERRAFDSAADMGVFSNTNTQVLASGGSGDPMFTGPYYHIQKAAGFMFNAMEHHNRMTTYLAAYRLGVKQGMSHDDAVNHANDLTWDSHFDYTNANRPRVLQNDTAKVIGLFKQYSWGVTYRLAREFRDTINSELPAEQRRGAAMAFGGLIGRQMMFSGVTGLPLYWIAESVVNAVMGDKDRPYDMTAAVKKHLADSMGQTASDAIMTGPVGAATGASLSGGASYNDLWYRPPSKDETAPQYATDAVSQLTGAITAIPLNMATGLSMMHEGQVERGFEHFVPPEASALMKAARYSQEGVTNLKGEQVLTREQLNDKDLFLQAAGFTPQKVADAYAQNTAIKNAHQEVSDRRKQLINQLAVASSVNDSDRVTETLDEINDFNSKNMDLPGALIKDPKSLVSAGRNLLIDQAEAVNGVKLPPGYNALYSQYGSQPKEGP